MKSTMSSDERLLIASCSARSGGVIADEAAGAAGHQRAPLTDIEVPDIRATGGTYRVQHRRQCRVGGAAAAERGSTARAGGTFPLLSILSMASARAHHRFHKTTGGGLATSGLP